MILCVPGCPLYFGHFLLFCCFLKYTNSVPIFFTEYWKCSHVQTHAVMPGIFSASVTPPNNLQKEDCRVRRTIVCFYLQTSKSQGLDKSRQNHDVSVNSNLRALFSCQLLQWEHLQAGPWPVYLDHHLKAHQRVFCRQVGYKISPSLE